MWNNELRELGLLTVHKQQTAGLNWVASLEKKLMSITLEATVFSGCFVTEAELSPNKLRRT